MAIARENRGAFFYARKRYEAGGSIDWAALAQDEGFADQSHLGRAARRITGFAPGEFGQRFVAKIVNATIAFVADARGDTTALILHQGGRDRTMQRIDAATAEAIEAAMEAKLRHQTPTPGSKAARQHLGA